MADSKTGTPPSSHLFKPRKIGQVTALDSVRYAARSVASLSSLYGSITEREIASTQTICYIDARIITNQIICPDPARTGKAYLRQIAMADEGSLPVPVRIAKMPSHPVRSANPYPKGSRSGFASDSHPDGKRRP